jgi:putative hydrolase of the HAD superfamily
VPAALRAVLLDAVGTLIRPGEPVGETYARVARRHGAEASAARLQRSFRRAHARAPVMAFPDAPAARVPERERAWWRDRVQESFRDADLRVDDFDACFAALWQRFCEPAAWRVLPGARAALAELRARGLVLAVVSNFDHRLPGLLAGLGLAPLLDAVVLPCQARAAKPDPAIFAHALARLDCAPDVTAVVGDDPERDLAPARRAGLRAIDVRELATLADLPARLADPGVGARTARSRP